MEHNRTIQNIYSKKSFYNHIDCFSKVSNSYYICISGAGCEHKFKYGLKIAKFLQYNSHLTTIQQLPISFLGLNSLNSSDSKLDRHS